MNDDPDTIDLITEIERYLATIEVFRAERCEPTWLSELTSRLSADRRAQPRTRTASSAPGAKSSH